MIKNKTLALKNIKMLTLTGVASLLIFPQETASSGLAPESLLKFFTLII